MDPLERKYLDRFRAGGGRTLDPHRPYERRVIGPENIEKAEPSIQRFGSEWTKTAGGGGPTGPFPFDVAFSAGSDVDHNTATVRPGTINGIVPTNILTAPDLAIATTYYLVLSVVAADGEIASCSLSFPTTAPAPIPVQLGQPPTAWDYVLGIIVGGAALTWYRTLGNGSIYATGSEVFRVPKVSPSPGTLPYDLYWTWAINTA